MGDEAVITGGKKSRETGNKPRVTHHESPMSPGLPVMRLEAVVLLRAEVYNAGANGVLAPDYIHKMGS